LTQEPRKASEVLLDLEQKLDVALNIIRSQDLNIKILSNKLNAVLEALEKKGASEPKFMVEAVHTTRPVSMFHEIPELDPEKEIPVEAEFKLPLEKEPNGFRRTSRPETFAGDDVYLQPTPKPPTPPRAPSPPPGRTPQGPPPGRTAEVVVPPANPSPNKRAALDAVPPKPQERVPVQVVQNAIPVQQRVVNKHGKSLFLADVEIIDLSSMQQICKTRTNGMGKWMASLGIGHYRVIIRKMENTTKEKLEVTQDIEIDGTQSTVELQTVIIKA
jgi:hypothetical protein